MSDDLPDPPERLPAVPLVFGEVLREQDEAMPERMAAARARWLSTHLAKRAEPRWRPRFARVVVPTWARWVAGISCIVIGVALVLRAPPPNSTRADWVVPVDPLEQAALAFANEASPEELARAGVYPKGVSAILAGRPFPSLAAVDAAPGVGRRTLEALRRGAKRASGG